MLKIWLFTRAPLRHLLPAALGVCAMAACPAAMALTISGKPSAGVVAGKPYSFTPASTDTSGKTRVFKITSKPSWAAFNTKTGQLAGTPSSATVGYYYNIIISVSDGSSSAALPAFFVHVEAADKTPPVVSGSPPTSVTVGGTYTFQPTARNPSGNGMWYAITNKPSWATFSIYTGLLTGKPTSAQVGTYSSISIRATDGQMSGSTSAFNITVKSATTAPPPATGTATLGWTPPTENTNGTTLTNLAGYRLHYGTSASNLSTVVQVPGASVKSYTLKNLGAATWYFGITAYTATGLESAMSRVVSKAVN